MYNRPLAHADAAKGHLIRWCCNNSLYNRFKIGIHTLGWTETVPLRFFLHGAQKFKLSMADDEISTFFYFVLSYSWRNTKKKNCVTKLYVTFSSNTFHKRKSYLKNHSHWNLVVQYMQVWYHYFPNFTFFVIIYDTIFLISTWGLRKVLLA